MTKTFQRTIVSLAMLIIGVATGFATPSISSVSVTDITESSATLTGKIKPDGVAVAYYFEYGKSSSLGSSTTVTKISATTSTKSVSADISGLTANTTYYYRLTVGYSGSSGMVYINSSTQSFTTSVPEPTITIKSPTNLTATSVTLNAAVNNHGLASAHSFEYGKTASYGSHTSIKSLSAKTTTQTFSTDLSGLEAGTTYHYRLLVTVSGSDDSYYSDDETFTTNSAGSAPTVTLFDVTDITATTATLHAFVHPHGLQTTYYFQYMESGSSNLIQTSAKTLAASTTGSEVSVTVTGLKPSTTYLFNCVAKNSEGSDQPNSKSFTTSEQTSTSPFSDCPSADQCGSTNYGDKIYEAAIYLYNKGIVKGVNGKLLPDDQITRGQLAKLALYTLYGGESKVPSTLVSDYFPSIYADLQDESTYYYRAAKALLYLEYKDGTSPFDRDRYEFNPEGSIERNMVLKVLCETFNIAKASSSASNPFTDFTSSQNAWGYAAKGYSLGIVQTTTFKPFTYCTRGDAILYLYRILTGGKVSIPTPNNTESFSSSDFFIPANYTPKNMAALRGISSGNFNYYEKDFFEIPGYMPLQFGVNYNSCVTEFPSQFYDSQPMGSAWSHSYNYYLNFTSGSDGVIYIHQPDGSLLFYKKSDLSAVNPGNHTVLTRTSGYYVLTTPTKEKYTFKRIDSAAGDPYFLTSVEDIHGTTKTLDYEKGVSVSHRITKVSTLGRSLTFAYKSGSDLLQSVTDPIGRKVKFTYNSDNLLASLTDAKSQTTTFNYGTAAGETALLKTITLPRGNTVTNTYEQRKLTSTQTNSNTPTTVKINTAYDEGTTVSKVTEPVTNSQTLTTTYNRDLNGNIVNLTDDNTKDVDATYGDSNNPTLPTKIVNNKTGLTYSFTYNSDGYATKTVVTGGSKSITTSQTYNSDNQVTSSTDGNGNKTTYTYSDGSLTSVTDALGNTTTITNNSYGSPTKIVDASGKTVNLSYNSYGNVLSANYPDLGITTSNSFDNISRITESIDGKGQSTTYSYDNNDNMLSTTDAAGHTTSYGFDANDNLISITNAKGGKTSLTYDSNDLMTGQSFQGHDKSFDYYDSGALRSYTTPGGETLSYSYNESGQLTDNDYATFNYNSKGQLISVEKDGNSIDYTYDALQRVSSKEYDNHEISYSYDNNGNVTEITYPGNKIVSYSYDALNRVESVTDWNGASTTYSYNADGTVAYVQFPNKVRTTYSYDKAGRPTGLSTKRNSGSGSTIVEYSYTLDKNGNHLSENIKEVYDDEPALNSEDIAYSYNSDNRITKAGSLSFGFDGNGNTTSRTGRTMKYDVANNLITVSGDFTASYTYDGLGNRCAATRDGVTTKYILDGSNVVAETNASGTIQYYYIYGPTGLISRISASGTTRYYITDSRSSVVAMTDATTSANITHKYQYDDFGNVTKSEEEDTNLFRYVGGQGIMYEADGLYFMRARYYDPTIGRFLSEDPIWSTNLYPYCGNNPITYFDPTGKALEFASELLEAKIEFASESKETFYIIRSGLKSLFTDVSNGAAEAAEKAGLDAWFDGQLATVEGGENVVVTQITNSTSSELANQVAAQAARKAALSQAAGYALEGGMVVIIVADCVDVGQVVYGIYKKGWNGYWSEPTDWISKGMNKADNWLYDKLDKLFGTNSKKDSYVITRL